VNNLTLVQGNNCQGNGASSVDGAGIHATGRANRIDNNMTATNDRGVDVDSTGDLIMRNDATNNATNFDISAGKTNANVETPGANFVLTRPWANSCTRTS